MATDLFILAMDDRDSLAKLVYGIAGTPDAARGGPHRARQAAHTPRAARRARPGCRSVCDRHPGRRAVRSRRGPPCPRCRSEGRDAHRRVRPGVLHARVRPDRRADVELDHVERFSPDYVKVLVRDNPDFDPSDRKAQQQHLAVVSAALHDVHRTFLFELLVPPTDEQHDRLGHDFDARLRPHLTEQVIADFQTAGVEPDIWKIEGLEDAAAANDVVAVTRRGGRDNVRCIVLGRDAPVDNSTTGSGLQLVRGDLPALPSDAASGSSPSSTTRPAGSTTTA